MFACIRSGVAFITYIVFAIDDAVFPWMDRGKPRSAADALNILNIENSKYVSGAVRWLELLRTDQVKERTTFTPSQIIEAFKGYDHARIHEALVLARRVYNADQTPIGMATALAYTFAEREHELGLRDQFFNAWATGNYASPMTPIRLCSERIRGIKEYSQGRVHDVVRCALWIIAWNFVVHHKRANKAAFEWHTDERFPAISG
jgi:hypothetical protein